MIRSKIDIRQLCAFIAVAEELNFVKASSRLFVSQPALSQTIVQLENTIGVQLFDRTKRKVSLTIAGHELLKDALTICDRIEQFMDKAHDHAHGHRGILKVGFLMGTAVHLMPQILRTFIEQYPDVKVIVQEYDFSSPEAGIDEDMDVSILRPPIDSEQIHLTTLIEEQCVACLPTSHSLAHADTVSIYDLLDDPIVAAPGKGKWRNYWIGEEYRNGRAAPVIHEAATVESELQTVASGRGISITAQSTALYYARPGVCFSVIRDMSLCNTSIALPADPSVAASNFMKIALELAQSTTP